ncbi:MAG: hypothetical protein K2W94_06270 [Alphaproteobacteria bacterium]|nr:hypothetical protein [Alphaproteobacteria bacterium]
MNFINNTSQPKPEIPAPLPNTVPLLETDPSQKPPYVPIPDDIEPDPKSPNPQPTPP